VALLAHIAGHNGAAGVGLPGVDWRWLAVDDGVRGTRLGDEPAAQDARNVPEDVHAACGTGGIPGDPK
jgi:hypothetical protein